MPGPGMVVRTTRTIAAGEPLSLSYLAAGRTAAPRAELLANWGIVAPQARRNTMDGWGERRVARPVGHQARVLARTCVSE